MPEHKSRPSKRPTKQGPKRRTTAMAPARRTRRESVSAKDLEQSARWPVERVFVPRHEPWRVSGCGSAAIARRRPDGRLITSFFWISLIEGGLTMTYGSDAIDDEGFDEFMTGIAATSPPLERTTDAALLGHYVCGAYALSRSLGYEWPRREIERYVKLVPQAPGGADDWLDAFIAPDGLVSPALWSVIETVQDAMDDMPKKMEVAIVTEAEFALTDQDRDRAVEALRTLDPEFINSGGDDDSGEEFFDYTREYPKDHWSPLKLLGGPQIIGSVAVRPGALIAGANTLSMACRLVNRLKDLFGDAIRLRCTRWIEPLDEWSGEQWEPGHGPTLVQ